MYLLSRYIYEYDPTCLTRFLEDDTLKMPTVCSPNCSKCLIHIITTVGTHGDVDDVGEEAIPIPSSSKRKSESNADDCDDLEALARRTSGSAFKLSIEVAEVSSGGEDIWSVLQNLSYMHNISLNNTLSTKA